MTEVCLSNREQPELERLCPRNSSLETENTHLGRPMLRPWIIAIFWMYRSRLEKTVEPEILEVKLEILGRG